MIINIRISSTVAIDNIRIRIANTVWYNDMHDYLNINQAVQRTKTYGRVS